MHTEKAGFSDVCREFRSIPDSYNFSHWHKNLIAVNGKNNILLLIPGVLIQTFTMNTLSILVQSAYVVKRDRQS